jgi:hypothetical protein
MKRLALTGIATLALALGAFAQTFILDNTSDLVNGVADLTAGSYYNGPYGLEVFQLNPVPTGAALNSLLASINGTSASLGANLGSAGLAVMTAAGSGFTSYAPITGQTMANGYISGLGQYTMAGVPAGANVVLGLAVWNSSGAQSTATHLGVIAFQQSTVSTTSSPPGIPLDIVGGGQPAGFGWNSVDGTGADLVMTTLVPEPGTLALAGLGVAALLIFRRRK